MPAYSHLLDEERDQIAVIRAAGRSICAIAREDCQDFRVWARRLNIFGPLPL
jgi:hypothetical protein